MTTVTWSHQQRRITRLRYLFPEGISCPGCWFCERWRLVEVVGLAAGNMTIVSANLVVAQSGLFIIRLRHDTYDHLKMRISSNATGLFVYFYTRNIAQVHGYSCLAYHNNTRSLYLNAETSRDTLVFLFKLF